MGQFSVTISAAAGSVPGDNQQRRFLRTENQDETVNFLREALGRIDNTNEVKTVETHISHVFIARTLAWKLKKAVRRPYLDFSTARQRLKICENELALNRRTAPEIYLQVRRLVSSIGGELVLDGEGKLIDAVLEMKRFDEDKLLDRMAQRGELTTHLVTRLAAVVANFHADAEPHIDQQSSGSERVEAVLGINEAGLAGARRLFGDRTVDDITARTRSLWERHRPLMDERQYAKRVRHCHGDLHLRNIVEIGGEPVLFDCLEFNPQMAITDVLYDLAFLLMDLWHRDLRALANLLFNRYLDSVDEIVGLPLMPLFLAMRATVRAHVLATQAVESNDADKEALAEESRAYLELARSFLLPQPACLVAIGGYSGSGKSTIAAALAHDVHPAPGARILSSDRIRKNLFKVAPETRLPTDAYQSEISAKVYELQREEAAKVLAAGHGVIVDAVFDRHEERVKIEQIAEASGAAFRGVWLEAPKSTLIERIEGRRNDPSDATVDVLHAQLERTAGTINWQRFGTQEPAALETIAAFVHD